MKLTTFLLFVLFFQVSAGVFSQNNGNLTLKAEKESINSILRLIEEKSEYRFLFNSSNIDVERKTDINVSSKNIEEVLKQLFEGTNVKYRSFNGNYVLYTEDEILHNNAQQQKTVTGKINDSTGGGLPGVSVVVKGTTTGTITDFDGNYSLPNIPVNATLVFSFVGMKSQEIAVGTKTSINVQLEDETIGIEEVVAIGYGVQKKSVVTGAISSVKADEMMSSADTKAEQALQGKTSGVQVVSTSGAPGAGMKIRIRGYSSNGKSDPLYIVDGLRTNDISGLEPTDIESMEVLKDGASAAIYGAEGGNGVVLITTKSGKAGRSEVSYNFQYTMQSLGRTPEVMNATQYIDYMKESGALTNITNPEGYNTDWIKKSFEVAPMQKHNINFSGGNDKTNYLASISYLDQQGIVSGDNDNYKRFSGMFNGSRQLNDWLKFGSSIQLSRSTTNSISENSEFSGVIASAILMDPLTPVTYTGEIPAHVQTLINQGKPVMTDENGNYYGISKYVTGENINPFVRNNLSKTENRSDKVMGNMTLDITPFKGFSFTSKLGINYSLDNIHRYNPQFYYSSETLNANASVSENVLMTTYWQWENYASYLKSIEKHNFTFLVGTANSSREYKTISASGYPLIKDQESFANLDYISTQANSKVAGSTIKDNKVSYFTRVNYDYANKYMLQATIRRDAAGMSILPKAQRWGIFPSISAGWVISSEEFFPKLDFLSYVKLRASWGQNGSLSNLGNYSYASNIMSSGLALSYLTFANVNVPNAYPLPNGAYAQASYPSVLGNKQLAWETSEQSDFGIDFRLFDGKMGLTIDYYNKKTKDLITTNTPPLEAGNNASPINGGNVLNRGIDFELNWQSKIGSLKYNIRANLSTLHNEVTYLDPTISRLVGTDVNKWISATAFEKGYPVWYFRGYKTNGINPTTGNINIVDVDGNGVINNNDFTNIGSAIPDFNFGTTLNLEYKGVDFTMFVQGQQGNEILMGLLRPDRLTVNKLSLFYEDRWTPNNTNASRPSSTVDAKYWTSDQMIFDGSFIKIKQIQLGYTLPKSLLDKVKIGQARMYVSLEDFFTFTKYPGMDPEAASTENNSLGIDRGYFPISKKLLFGLSLKF